MNPGVLKGIESPKDLKRLTPGELKALTEELRAAILDTISKTGGHLGGNLGVVELTVALHRVFDAPEDKIIWDVGHQAYAHKLLTGRRDRFGTIRQFGGLSGFTNRAESAFDPFGAGHGSTSLSAAIGFAAARDLRGERHKVVAVIGDASLGGGMALAALNYIGHARRDLLIILNDNKMSISPPVGALAGYLNRIITGEFYNRFRGLFKRTTLRMPTTVGKAMLRAAQLAEESVKGMVSPGILFEELGIKYIGPVDGHDLETLIGTLERVKAWKGPVLIHAITVKGKGYPVAEEKQVWSHGPGPFDKVTGQALAPSGMSYSQVFGESLAKLADRDPRVVAITAAMSEGTGLKAFADAHPDRLFDVGMCEEHAVTYAAGLAAGGLRPVAAIYSTFLQRGYDQIIHDVCRQRLPVVFALDRAGVVGEDGDTHQGVFDLGYFRLVPNTVIGVPATPQEVVGLLKAGLAHDGPFMLRYPKEKADALPNVDAVAPLTIGEAEVVRQGKDAVVFALGPLVREAVAAAEHLAQHGLEVAVVNARWVKPLDAELLVSWAKKTKRILTVEDHAVTGGFGSAVLELLAERGLPEVEVRRLGVPDEFVLHGKRAHFLHAFGLTAEGIGRALKELCGPAAPAAAPAPARRPPRSSR